MSKQIIVCLDGTWNGPDVKQAGEYTPTNVQRLFEALKGSGPLNPADQEREFNWPAGDVPSLQVGKYLYGVGDQTTNALAHAVAGAVGLGLVARVVRGYTYISRMYEAGDDIHVVGFSRGAYAARALAGLIVSQGLLDWKAMALQAGSEASYSAGFAAWKRCRAAAHADEPSVLHGLADIITRVHDAFEFGLHPAPALKFVPDVPLASVGVWDTVGALGIPDIREQDGTTVRTDVFQFADNKLSTKVRQGFHAMAVDEQRVDFTPTPWAPRDGVVQVLFPGAHADVGGGYPGTESGLAGYALAWMARRLATAGVLLQGMPPPIANAIDMQHRPWANGPHGLVAARHFGPDLRLSQRVMQRIDAGPVPVEGQTAAAYRPTNLSNSYVLLDWTAAAPHVQIES